MSSLLRQDCIEKVSSTYRGFCEKNSNMITMWGFYFLVYLSIGYYQILLYGKSPCSDWLFLGQDFTVRTVSMETVQSVYFCFGVKPANSTFATKTVKKIAKLSFFTLKLPAEAKKIEIFPKFHGPIHLFLFWSKAGKFNICNQDSEKTCEIVILHIETTSRS